MLPIHDVVTRKGDVASAMPVIVAIIALRLARMKTVIAVKKAKRIGGNQMTRARTSSEAAQTRVSVPHGWPRVAKTLLSVPHGRSGVAQTLLSVPVLAPSSRAAPPAAT